MSTDALSWLKCCQTPQTCRKAILSHVLVASVALSHTTQTTPQTVGVISAIVGQSFVTLNRRMLELIGREQNHTKSFFWIRVQKGSNAGVVWAEKCRYFSVTVNTRSLSALYHCCMISVCFSNPCAVKLCDHTTMMCTKTSVGYHEFGRKPVAACEGKINI